MIGARLGAWSLEAELGRGSMGTVYRARREGPGQPDCAAVKVLASDLAVEPGFRHRFQREIEALRQLDHPHIVRFLEAGEIAGRPWFAMEYVAGPNCEEVLKEHGRQPWAHVLALALQVAPALKHAHDHGIVHRDLKLSNLLRDDQRDLVKLTDFGIASLFARPHLTVAGAVLGTPAYLSPEQAAGKQATKRSDLYSLGVSLYALVTGRFPFAGEPLELLHQHRYAQFDRPSRYVPDLPPDLDELLCQLLAKEPEKRPPDAGVLARQLERIQKKQAFKAAHASQPAEPDLEEVARAGPGPATLMSRLMREELERANRPGPVGRVFSSPFVLVPAFLLCVSFLVWTFWPMRPESLFQSGSELMASEDPDDWDRAWERYLTPLETRDRNGAYREELARLRAQYDDRLEERRAERWARKAAPVGDGQWFFQQGLQRRRRGDEEGARKTWNALVAAFAAVPAEAPWVRRARRELGLVAPAPNEKTLQSARAALDAARKLEQEGKKGEAESVRQGLKELYGEATLRRLLGER